MTVRELDTAVRKTLESLPAENENSLSLSDLRQSLNEFFDSLEEKFQRAPAARSDPQWELVMVDGVPDRPAVFFLLCMLADRVEWTAGLGLPQDVRSFAAAKKLRKSLPEVHLELSKVFRTAAAFSVEAKTFFAWSGYDPL